MNCKICNCELADMRSTCSQIWFECMECGIKSPSICYKDEDRIQCVKSARVAWLMMQEYVERAGVE